MLFLLLLDTDMSLQNVCLEELHNAKAMHLGHHQKD